MYKNDYKNDMIWNKECLKKHRMFKEKSIYF